MMSMDLRTMKQPSSINNGITEINWLRRRVRMIGVSASGLSILLCAALASLAQDSKSNQEQSPPNAGVQLSTRSPIGEMIVPAHLHLGTFAIDLGLPDEAESALVQRHYVMASILAAAISRK